MYVCLLCDIILFPWETIIRDHRYHYVCWVFSTFYNNHTKKFKPTRFETLITLIKPLVPLIVGCSEMQSPQVVGWFIFYRREILIRWISELVSRGFYVSSWLHNLVIRKMFIHVCVFIVYHLYIQYLHIFVRS